MMAKKSSTKFDMKRMTCLRGSVHTCSTLRNHSWVALKDNGSICLLKSSQSHVLWILAKPKHSHFLTKLYKAIKLFQEVLVLHGWIMYMGTSGAELAGLAGSMWLKVICWLCLSKEMGIALCHQSLQTCLLKNLFTEYLAYKIKRVLPWRQQCAL